MQSERSVAAGVAKQMTQLPWEACAWGYNLDLGAAAAGPERIQQAGWGLARPFAGSPMSVGRVRSRAEQSIELSGERKINMENWVGVLSLLGVPGWVAVKKVFPPSQFHFAN